MNSIHDLSPVTGILREDQVVLDFGKYEGRTVDEIAKVDPDFYNFLISKRDTGQYAIRRNRDKTFRLYMNPAQEIEV